LILECQYKRNNAHYDNQNNHDAKQRIAPWPLIHGAVLLIARKPRPASHILVGHFINLQKRTGATPLFYNPVYIRCIIAQMDVQSKTQRGTDLRIFS
jgi:hypothetical protein